MNRGTNVVQKCKGRLRAIFHQRRQCRTRQNRRICSHQAKHMRKRYGNEHYVRFHDGKTALQLKAITRKRGGCDHDCLRQARRPRREHDQIEVIVLVFKGFGIATTHRIGNRRERTIRNANRHYARVGKRSTHHMTCGFGRHNIEVGMHETRTSHDIVFRICMRIQHKAASEYLARRHNNGKIHIVGRANGNGALLRHAARIAPIAGKRIRAVVRLSIGDARRHAHSHAFRAIRLVAMTNSTGKCRLSPRRRKGPSGSAAHNSSGHRQHNLRNTQDPRDEVHRHLMQEPFSYRFRAP